MTSCPKPKNAPPFSPASHCFGLDPGITESKLPARSAGAVCQLEQRALSASILRGKNSIRQQSPTAGDVRAQGGKRWVGGLTTHFGRFQPVCCVFSIMLHSSNLMVPCVWVGIQETWSHEAAIAACWRKKRLHAELQYLVRIDLYTQLCVEFRSRWE